jgi:hypothetical protein
MPISVGGGGNSMGGERLSWHILLIPLQLVIASLVLESVGFGLVLLYINRFQVSWCIVEIFTKFRCYISSGYK